MPPRSPALAALALALAASTACDRATNTPPNDARHASAPAADARVRDAARIAPNATHDAAVDDRSVASLLTLAFPLDPLPPSEADRLLADIPSTTDPALLRAMLFAAARRVPTSHIGRLLTITPVAHRDLVARGLAGRPRAHAPRELPTTWFGDDLSIPPSVALATLVARFRLDLPTARPVHPYLAAADLDQQLAGARLLTVRAAALPPDQTLDALTPYAVASIARALAARPDVPSPLWETLLRTTAARARIAPRLWGNAWRATRDAVPTQRPELATALRAAIDAGQNPPGLVAATLAWWNCENALAADKINGMPLLTPICAPAGHEWVSRVAQAQVLGSKTTEPGIRADALEALRRAADGNPWVLTSIATAATSLPVSASGRVVRRLADERDPAVMAAVIEGLNDHPEHANALPPNTRADLVRAPFAQPEGPTLEARIQAIRLARTLRMEDIVVQAQASRVRAVALAAGPDAAIQVRPGDNAPPPTASVVRFHIDAGVFDLELRPEHAPAAVRTVLDAVRARRYDGLTFHRVVPAFVAQGGDPRGDGYGGMDTPVTTELSLQRFERGAIGIPLAGLDTGGIQLFIVLADAPHLDGRYPWAGFVRRGMEAVDGLLIGDRIHRAEIVDVAPSVPPR